MLNITLELSIQISQIYLSSRRCSFLTVLSLQFCPGCPATIVQAVLPWLSNNGFVGMAFHHGLFCHAITVLQMQGAQTQNRKKFCIGNEKYTCEWSEGGHGSTSSVKGTVSQKIWDFYNGYTYMLKKSIVPRDTADILKILCVGVEILNLEDFVRLMQKLTFFLWQQNSCRQMHLKSIEYTDTVLFPTISKAGDVLLPYIGKSDICCKKVW